MKSPLISNVCRGLAALAAGALLASGLTAPAAAPRYHIQEMPTLGGNHSRALGINGRGHVVGEAQTPAGVNRAVLWHNGTLTDLGTLGGDRAQAYAINNAGFITGRARNAGGRDRPFLYDPATQTMTELPTAGGQSASNVDDGTGFGINDAKVVGGHSRNAAGQLEAFFWQNGVTTGVGTPGGAHGRAWDINESGQLAGWGLEAGGATVAYRWSPGTGFDLIPALQAGDEMFGIGINDLGHVVGSATATGRSRAWLWDGSTLTDLGQAPGFTGAGANRVNNHGQVAGLSYRFNAQNQRIDNTATVWIGGQAVNLNEAVVNGSGWHLESAYHMNDAGQIVGWGRKSGNTRGFLLTPLPGKLYAIGGFDPDDTGMVPHRIYELDPVTGKATPLPGSFKPEPAGLAATADGRLLALNVEHHHHHGEEPPPAEAALVEIDPFKGFITKLATVPVEAYGFDILPDGRAFTIPMSTGGTPVQLHAVNLETGAATPVGSASAIDDAFAAAFGSAPAANKRATQLASVGGHLYAIVRHGTNANLVRLDPGTGAATVLGAANAVNTANGGAYRGIPGLSGRDSNGDGVFDELYGVLNYHDHDGDPETRFRVIGALIKFDLNDGTWSIVGTNPGLLFSGLASTAALNPTPAPEPLAFTFETFDVEGGTETLLSDIRNDGALVGRFKDSGGISQGFIQEGTNRTVFNVTGTTATFAGGLDSAGRVAGFYRNATNPAVQHGFIRETNGSITTIDGPGQTTTYAWRINDAGQVNGYWFEDPFFITSFRRETNGALTTNVFAGSPIGTVTRGMNDAGHTAGWKWDENFTLQGVIFAGGATNVITVAGWEHTLPGDINNLGEIAGTVNNAFTTTAGFFRRANGDTVTFNPPGAVEVEVFGLNDLGQVVGEYADAGGARHGFIAQPAVKLPRGHTDIGIAFEDGVFDLHIHDEETDTEYAPGGAVLCVGTAAELAIPDTAALSFLGRAGYSTWILPAVQNTNLLFLGFGAEEVESGVFIGDVLRMELASVTGAGDFAVFSYDGFGNPIVPINSADGISAADFFLVTAGGHTDLNWAFSAPGTYRIGFRARGTLVAGNQELLSEIAYYTFVVPQPLLPQPPEPDDSFVYNVIDLGTFGGTDFNTAIDVNNLGVVVGASSLSNNIDHPIFRWENGVLENLGLLGGRTAGADAISDTGWIVGTTTTPAGDFEPYVPYRLGTNLVFEPIPLILGAQNGEAHDVNDFGTTVGALDLPDFSSRAFLSFTNAPTIDLGTFGGESSGAEGINSSGVIVGWAQLSNGQTRAFRHLGTGPLNAATDDLGTLGGNSSRAFAVSESGKIVGRSRTTNGVQHAFLWEEGTGMTDLGSLGGDNTYAFGINTNDVVTGWGNLVPGGDPTHGWVWTPDTGMRDLNTLIPFRTGLEVTLAYGVNEAGWIACGADRLDNGASRPVLLKPATRLSRGHTDIGMAFEDGEWDLHVHSEDLDAEFEPGAALLTLPPLTQTIVPTNASYAFLGTAGSATWVLPSVQNPKLLFLGFGAEEIESGLFVSNIVTMKLKAVDGPGAFSVFSIDGFGVPVVHMNSGDGIDTNGVKTIVTGSHEDFAWAFSAPGYYRVTFEACGTLVAGNEFSTSGDVTYFFEVIPIETQLAITRSGGNATISFLTQDGLTYQLEAAPTVTGPWTNEGTPFLGTGRTKQITVPLSSGAAFFKMKATVGN